MINRRDFFRAGMAGTGLLVFSRTARAADPWAPNSPKLKKFVTELKPSQFYNLRISGSSTDPNFTQYVSVNQFQQWMHPGTAPDGLPPNTDWGATTLWGYHDELSGPLAPNTVFNPLTANAPAGGYLGPVIVAMRDSPTKLRVSNRLPNQHILPVDTSIVGSLRVSGETFMNNRIAVHLHGGLVYARDDGHPLAWFSPGVRGKGAHFVLPTVDTDNTWPGFVTGDKDPIYSYPNNQSARLLWYHDHAVALTRLNAYAGIASGYALIDGFELEFAGTPLVGKGVGLPVPGIPLILQDKAFNADGSLWYPSVPDPLSLGTNVSGEEFPEISAVPEFFGDVNLVNGLVWPTLKVRKGKYRFRVLNGSQARFYRLRLVAAGSDGITPNLNLRGPKFTQIGTEGGFMPAPAVLNEPTNLAAKKLILAPGERADIIIDFAEGASGVTQWLLYNDAAGPFPSGDPVTNDTGLVMRFDIDPTAPGTGMTAIPNLAYAWAGQETLTGKQAPAEIKTLNEGFDPFGRLIQTLGTTEWVGNGDPEIIQNTFGRSFLASGGIEVATKDNIKVGSYGVWDIVNTTGDTHPMHTHLFDYQIISRQPFDVNLFNSSQGRTIRLLGPPVAPDPNEKGWKETGRCNPGQITRIAFKISDDPTYATDNGAGEYVWHCHILEHEEHDMMHGLKLTT